MQAFLIHQVLECFCPRKRHVETPKERRKWGESKEVGEGREDCFISSGNILKNKQELYPKLEKSF